MDAKTEGKLKELVKPEYWGQFVKFVASGETDPAFKAYLDADSNCQEAVGICLDAQGAVLRAAFAELDKAEGPPTTKRDPALGRGALSWRKYSVRIAASLAVFALGVGLIQNGLANQTRIRLLEGEMSRRDESLASQQASLAKLKEERDEAQANLRNANSKAQTLQDEANRLAANEKAIRDRLTQAETAKETYVVRIGELEKSLGDLKGVRARLEKELAANEEAVKKLQAESTALSTTVERLEKEAVAKGELIAKLQAENARLVQAGPSGDANRIALAAMCATLRNEPFPNKPLVARGIFADSSIAKVPYLVAMRASLDGKSKPGDLIKILLTGKQDDFLGRLAQAEGACMAGKPDELIALLGETEDAVLKEGYPPQGVDWTALIVQRHLAREAMAYCYKLNKKEVAPRLHEELVREGKRATKTAVALVLAEIGPEARDSQQSLQAAMKFLSTDYEKEVFSYATRKIGVSSKP